MAKEKPWDNPKILVDTREQHDYKFENCERATLKTGDYCLADYPDLAIVERKGLMDFIACVGKERKRFEAELERMLEFKYRAICIEATFSQLMNPPDRTILNRNQVVNSLFVWQLRYNLNVMYAGHHTHGQEATFRYLRLCLREHLKTESCVAEQPAL